MDDPKEALRRDTVKVTRVCSEIARDAQGKLIHEGFDPEEAEEIGTAILNLVGGRLRGGRLPTKPLVRAAPERSDEIPLTQAQRDALGLRPGDAVLLGGRSFRKMCEGHHVRYDEVEPGAFSAPDDVPKEKA